MSKRGKLIKHAARNIKKQVMEEAAPSVVMFRRQNPFDQTIGFINNPEPVANYRSMVTSDPTIAACLEFVSLAVVSKLGDYQHSDPDIESFVRENFERIEGSFVDTCKGLMSFLWAGFSVCEIVTQIIDDRIWLHSLPLLPAEYVKFHLNEDTASLDYGTIDEIVQNYGLISETHIPADKCLIVRNSYPGEQEQSPYGCSRLRCIMPNYVAKVEAEKYWTYALGRYGSPILMYELENPLQKVKSADGTVMTAFDQAMQQVNADGELKGVVSLKGNNLQMIYPPSGIGQAFRESCDYHNRLIMRGLLIPSLLFDNGDTGSYSLGQEHYKLFDVSLEALLSLLTEALLEQLVRPLIEWNFGTMDYYGEFEIKATSLDTQEKLDAMLAEDVAEEEHIEDQLEDKPAAAASATASEPALMTDAAAGTDNERA